MTRKKKCKPPRVYVQRIKINRQGYDSSGRYWGVGQPLFHFETERGDLSEFVRAPDRKKALVQAKARAAQKFCGTGGPIFGLPGGGEGLGAIPALGGGLAGRPGYQFIEEFSEPELLEEALAAPSFGAWADSVCQRARRSGFDCDGQTRDLSRFLTEQRRELGQMVRQERAGGSPGAWVGAAEHSIRRINELLHTNPDDRPTLEDSVYADDPGALRARVEALGRRVQR